MAPTPFRTRRGAAAVLPRGGCGMLGGVRGGCVGGGESGCGVRRLTRGEAQVSALLRQLVAHAAHAAAVERNVRRPPSDARCGGAGLPRHGESGRFGTGFVRRLGVAPAHKGHSCRASAAREA